MSLKIFLLALAIIDDLGAIIIIALFYTTDLSTTMLVGAGIAIAALILLNRLNVRSITPYVMIGTVLWWFVLKSGVHSTLAGVVLAFAIPLGGGKEGEKESPLQHLEHKLHPWVAFGVMPIFAFANAGVSLAGLSLDTFLQPLPLGIALGLFLGKQFGIFGGGLAHGMERLGAPAKGGELEPDIRCLLRRRHRFHHEPVHRHAGLHRLDQFRRRSNRRVERLDPFGGDRLWRAASGGLDQKRPRHGKPRFGRDEQWRRYLAER